MGRPLVLRGDFTFAGRSAVPVNGPFDPDYLSRITVDAASYAGLYAEARGHVTGDVSPVYLADEKAAGRIATTRPDARIVVLLRDPVERAFSQFLHHVRDGLEPCKTFKAALDVEPARLRDGRSWGHGYARYGDYAAQIARYLNAFPRDQILFLEFESLQAEPEVCWRKICAHLDLKARPLMGNGRVNTTHDLAKVASRPRIARVIQHPGRIQTLLKRSIPGGLRKKLRGVLEGRGRIVPTLSEPARNRLASRYRPERVQVEAQTGLSRAHWTQ